MGCKRHVICDARGTPLVVRTTPANVRDDVPAAAMGRAMPAVRQPRGRPRRRPRELLGDRGYGFPWVISAIAAMGIAALLAPRKVVGQDAPGHGSGLGRQRCVVERTGESFQAFHELAACQICAGKLAAGD